MVIRERIFKINLLKKRNFSLRKKLIFLGERYKKIHRRFIGVLDEEMARPENADALCTVWGKLLKKSLL